MSLAISGTRKFNVNHDEFDEFQPFRCERQNIAKHENEFYGMLQVRGVA